MKPLKSTERTMPKAFDGTPVPEFGDKLPCGETPRWDYGSACGYRCEYCGAMVGSIGMPKRCREMMEEERERELVIDRIGFKNENDA